MTLRIRETSPALPGVGISLDRAPNAVVAKAIEFHRKIVEGMTCGVLTIDREGTITTVNEQARATLDLGNQQALGRSCQEVLASSPRLATMLLESFRMASPPSREEMKVRARDGRMTTIGFSISMIGGAHDGGADGAALFFKDLTKVEEQEERERLRDRLAVLGEMAAQMAHEIRNPLTSIEISATLQKRRLVQKGDATDLVDRVSQEIRRIETTIANCLSYARPLSLERAPAAPAHLVEEAIVLARQRDPRNGIHIGQRVEPGLRRIQCDLTLLREALVNILLNAGEAMNGQGRIHVEASEEEGFIAVRVRDTGPGIPPEILSRIFYPFFTTKTTGSGIGLAMARKVVEAHGGWLSAESEPGEGATFILKLPVAAAGDEGTSGGEA